MNNPPLVEFLHARLRRSPSRFTVGSSLPVLFFGDLFNARIASVGLNPSDKEYLDGRGNLLDGPQRRFETLGSLGVEDRQSLTPQQCDAAIMTMRGYYQPGKPIYSWFRSLDRVVRGMGYRYETGEVAHLDLVQEATTPTWSGLTAIYRAEADILRAADEPFFRWQLDTFALRAAVCNGRTVFDEVRRITNATTIETGSLARLTWYAAVAHRPAQPLGIVGWNIPLARPTGLDKEGHSELGRLLAERLRAADVRLDQAAP